MSHSALYCVTILEEGLNLYQKSADQFVSEEE